MIVKLFDHTELTVSKEDGDKLKASLQRSSDGMVSVGGFMIKKSAIAYVKPGGYTQADVDAEQLLRGQDAMRRVGPGRPVGIGEIASKRSYKSDNKE